MKVVISLGGSLLGSKEFEGIIEELKNLKDKAIVVVGGGKKARERIKVTKTKNAFLRDLIGIEATKENAKEVAKRLGWDFFDLKCIEDFKKIKEGNVTGGFIPGLTTDAIATLIAELKGWAFVNLTNVDGVYNKDPKKFKDARLFKEIKINELIKIVQKADERKPGTNVVLDLFALYILRRSRIPAMIGKGSKENIKKIKEWQNIGTVIKYV